MESPPPVPQYAYPAPPRESPDEEHLKVLAICHWIAAGFSALGLLFLAMHFMFMRTMFSAEVWKDQPQGGPPEQFFTVMIAMYGFFALVLVLFLALNAMSARFLAMRKNRMFSLVVAGCNCIQVPLGTVLGIFTFIVLSRPAVVRMYETAAGSLSQNQR